MNRKSFRITIAFLCFVSVFLAQFGNIVSVFSVEPTAKDPILWYEDNFEHNNDLKIVFDDNAKVEHDTGRVVTEISTEDGTNNRVFKLTKKTVPASGSVNTQKINLFPQKADGSYALANDGDLESGKTYRYIVKYDYKVEEMTGYNGMYVKTAFSKKGEEFSAVKNTQGCCLASDYLYTQNIGTYGMLNLVAPLGQWETISTTTYCSSKDGITDPAITIQFELWRDFIGTVLFDNIRVYKVDEDDKVATVVYNANDSGVSRYNPDTYVVGAKFEFPEPQKSGYVFCGWYADADFTELCDNVMPENKVNNKYTVLYARWNENTLTDDFDQVSADKRIVSGNISVEKDIGRSNTSALHYNASGDSSGSVIPENLKGENYTVSVSNGTALNYIIEYEYKSESYDADSNIKICFDFVNLKNGSTLINSRQALFNISAKQGNSDGKWHKASFVLRFVSNKSAEATIMMCLENVGAADIVFDNLNIQKMSGRIGSFVFENDNYVGFIDPVAGEYGDLTGIDISATRSGYVLDGWYSDSEKIDINTFGTADYTVKPKWKKLVAPEQTTELFSDSFDEEVYNNRNIYSDVIVGPDTSEDGWFTDDFEQYDGDTIDINDNYEKVERPAGLYLTIEKEEDGNSYFRFKNTDNVLFRKNIIFRDSNGDPLFNQVLPASQKYTVIYKFKYKVNSAPSEGMWLTTLFCDKDTNDAGTKGKCFILADNKNAGSSYFYGNTDGNWHTVSFSTYYQSSSSKAVTPGFFLEFGSQWGIRKVDICFDDFSVKVIEGANKAVNYLCSEKPKSGQIGPTLSNFDSIACELGKHINFPNPYSDEYKFVGWTNSMGKIQETAPNTTNGNAITVYPKWEELTGAPVAASAIQYKTALRFGTGNTNALKLSAASAGQGSINLKDELSNTFTKLYSAGDRINWIIRFRYKITDPGSGITMGFDVAKPGSDVSLSKENGTAAQILFGGKNSNADALWHTASLPLALTRNDLEEGSAVTLKINFLAGSAFSGVYLDEISVFDAEDNTVSMFEFVNRDFVDPVAGVTGTTVVMPENPVALRSVGAWYNDSEYKNKFADVGQKVSFASESKVLYGESLTYDGFYATERFDNSVNIYYDRMNSNDNMIYLWDRFGLYGKLRKFSITQEDCHDEGGVGYSLKYDLRDDKFAADPSSSVLLTNGIDDQIKLGNTHDEEEKMYIVKLWYKVVEASTDVTFSVSAANYNSHWEGLNCENEVYQYPVMNNTGGKWRQMSMLLALSGDTDAKDIYLRFSVTGQALMYFDDFEVSKVKSGRGQTILFDTNGGNFIEPFVGEEGDAIPELPKPVKEGYQFKGWYTDYGYTVAFTQTEFAASNIYLNACWEENDTYTQSGSENKNYGIYIDSTNAKKSSYFLIDQAISGIEYGEYTVSFDCLTVKSSPSSKIGVSLYGSSGECLSTTEFSDFSELQWKNASLSINNDKKVTNLKFNIAPGFEGYIDNIVLKNSSGKVVYKLNFDSDDNVALVTDEESDLYVGIREVPVNDEANYDLNDNLYSDTDTNYQYEDIIEEYPVTYNKTKTTISKIRVSGGLSTLDIILIVIGSVAAASGIAFCIIFILIKRKKKITASQNTEVEQS